MNPIFIAKRSLVLALTFAGLQLGCAGHNSRESIPTNGEKAAPPQARLRVPTTQPDEAIARIRDEGLNRSQVMAHADYLCNVIGPRLTASPNAKRANEWTRDQFAEWGLADAHLEEWGPFGRGWQVKRFSMQVIEPTSIALNAYPKAWSPGFDRPIEAPVTWIDAQRERDLEKYKGKLKGHIVLLGQPREVEARFEPLARRITDEDLDKLAAAEPGDSALLGISRTQTPSERRAAFAEGNPAAERLVSRAGAGRDQDAQANRAGPATRPASPATRPSRRGAGQFSSRLLSFAADEGAILVVTPSNRGDGGTMFLASASVPGEQPRAPRGGAEAASEDEESPTTTPAAAPTTGPTTRPRAWAVDAPKIPAQVQLIDEHYNRLVSLAKSGATIKIACDLQVEFFEDDLNGYNTIAEIPGVDPKLKHEIVMVGAHLDSWHSGTGATDNAAGSVCAMEAVRIIKALNLQPKRTIRVALWTGEEQGLYGSRAYVKKHFGHDPDAEAARARGQQQPRRPDPADAAADAEDARPATRPAPTPKRIVKEPAYEKLSVYFNLDNGTGKIRGIYAQSNTAAAPIFNQWLAYFHDVGANTVSLSNTGSTDHVAFDSIGLPGFQFIQDPMEYSSRTHHSNMDTYDRLQAADLKQASTIMAAFVWRAANMDERFPRKPLETPSQSQSQSGR